MSGEEENKSIPEVSNETKEEASDPPAPEESKGGGPPTVDDVMAQQEQQDVAEKKESDDNLVKEMDIPKQEQEEKPVEEEAKPEGEDEEAKKSSESAPPEELPVANDVAAATEVADTVIADAAKEAVESSSSEKIEDKADEQTEDKADETKIEDKAADETRIKDKANETKIEEKPGEIKTQEEKPDETKIVDDVSKMEIDEPNTEEKSDLQKPDEKVDDGTMEEAPPADQTAEEKIEKGDAEIAPKEETPPEKKEEEMKEESTATTTSEKKEEEKANEDAIVEKKDEEPTPSVPAPAPTPNVPAPEVPTTTEAGKDQETASSGPEGDDDTSKAEDQSVGGARNEEGERTDDAMDTEDQNTNRTDPAEEQSTSSKGDLPYSTRGRSTGNDTASAGENWERGSALETLEEIGRAKESTAPPSLGASFLEALSEEERRTRTRFLPVVEGMHILRKAEVKDDLALARSLVVASGVTSLKKSKAKKSNSEDDAMDVDEEEGGSPSEDDRSSDLAKRSSVIEFRARDLVLPSGAFRAPKGTKGVSNEDGVEEREGRGGSKGNLQSPSVVESVTSFNPPRPPESIGAKKKHRMLRWERRPEDVEIDLNNYRKTVQRTRQELHSAEAEFNRLETIDAHLRWHYLSHLNLMNEEYVRLNDEFSSVQQECVKAADLLTSRTRSRGAGKGSYVMRDVLTILKTRGSEAKDKDSMDVDTSRVPLAGDPVNAGVGGLASLSFKDWNRSTDIEPMVPASSWIVAGENVKTPYGDGVVLSVQPAEDYSSFSGKPKEKIGDEEKSSESASGKGGDSASKGSKRKKDGSKPNVKDDSSSIARSILPARVSVKLKYGTGHFTLDAITPVDNPAVFSDAKLASRWKSMVDSALSVSGCLDVQGMTSIVQKASKENPESESSDMEDGQQKGVAGASQEDTEMADATNVNASGGDGKQNEDRTLPFGSSMLPTSSGRGNSLQSLPIVEVEEGTQKAFFAGRGVLGETTNQGVTEDFRTWEDDESEYVTLQASVLQLRNALVRQKRIRMLNEKTSVATSDRYRRAEELVSEMRSDLKSLKQRLEQELNELGIDEATAEQILSSYYEDNEVGGDDEEEEDGVESSHSKRRREEGEGPGSQYGVEDADYHGPGTDGGFSRDDPESRPAKKIRANQ